MQSQQTDRAVLQARAAFVEGARLTGPFFAAVGAELMPSSSFAAAPPLLLLLLLL